MAKDDEENDVSEAPEPEKEEDIYEEEPRDELEEDAEITPEEEGFMEGYEEEQKAVECQKCGRVIIEKEDAVKKEINGEHYIFCSPRCADAFKPGK